MRNPASQGRADQNHVELSAVYESLGCSVVNTYHVGGGFSDAVVGFATKYGRVTELVEFKMLGGGPTPAQVRFHRDWRGSKVRVVRTPEDVIAHIREVGARFDFLPRFAEKPSEDA